MIWAVIYDTFYAMVDREDDLKVGVKSTAILFGEVDIFVIAGLQLLMLVALILIGLRANLSIWFYLSVLVAGIDDGLPPVARSRPSASRLFCGFSAQPLTSAWSSLSASFCITPSIRWVANSPAMFFNRAFYESMSTIIGPAQLANRARSGSRDGQNTHFAAPACNGFSQAR